MKKITRIFTLVIAFLCLFTLAGCNTDQDKPYYFNVESDAKINEVVENIVADTKYKDIANKLIIGLYDHDSRLMYTINYDENLPHDEYMIIFVEKPKENDSTNNDESKEETKVLYPSIKVSGYNFGGWLFSEDEPVYDEDGNKKLDEEGQPITELKTKRVTDLEEKHKVLEAKMMSFAEAGLVAVVCIAIVFGMLALISGVLYLFKFITPKKVVETKQPVNDKPVVETRKAIKLEDIQDEDMMAAALVATIDYHEETGEDVRVVSIKEVR